MTVWSSGLLLPLSLCLFQLEKLIETNYYLHKSAKDGYRSYLQAYASHSLKQIFDVNALDLAKVGKAFGFTVPPNVNLSKAFTLVPALSNADIYGMQASTAVGARSPGAEVAAALGMVTVPTISPKSSDSSLSRRRRPALRCPGFERGKDLCHN